MNIITFLDKCKQTLCGTAPLVLDCVNVNPEAWADKGEISAQCWIKNIASRSAASYELTGKVTLLGKGRTKPCTVAVIMGTLGPIPVGESVVLNAKCSLLGPEFGNQFGKPKKWADGVYRLSITVKNPKATTWWGRPLWGSYTKSFDCML